MPDIDVYIKKIENIVLPIPGESRDSSRDTGADMGHGKGKGGECRPLRVGDNFRHGKISLRVYAVSEKGVYCSASLATSTCALPDRFYKATTTCDLRKADDFRAIHKKRPGGW